MKQQHEKSYSTSAPRIESLCQEWDCIVIGAGPAGSMAALQIAAQGQKVLLIDKNTFPRTKVCGCCINASAQSALEHAGLSNLLEDENAVELNDLILLDGKRRATISLPSAWSLSRERLDSALIDSAIGKGAVFLSDATALVLKENEFERIGERHNQSMNSLVENRHVKIQTLETNRIFSTKMIVVADGLGGRSLEELDELKVHLDQKSRFGAGTILNEAPDFYEPGRIYMACGQGGYVGFVRLEDGRLDVAAAFDVEFSRRFHGPAQAAMQVLSECGLPVPHSLIANAWSGTPALTRRRSKVAANRLLIAGDATGYPEPFTGEGIAWALWSGLWAGQLASIGVDKWTPELAGEWSQLHSILRGQQARSTMIAQMLRHRIFRKILIGTISALPSLASYLISRISNSEFSTRPFVRKVNSW